MGLFSRNKRHGLTKLEKLNTHTCGHGPLRFVEESPPVDAPLPEEWRALPALSPAERAKRAIPPAKEPPQAEPPPRNTPPHHPTSHGSTAPPSSTTASSTARTHPLVHVLPTTTHAHTRSPAGEERDVRPIAPRRGLGRQHLIDHVLDALLPQPLDPRHLRAPVSPCPIGAGCGRASSRARRAACGAGTPWGTTSRAPSRRAQPAKETSR